MIETPDDALTPFELVCTITGIEPGQARLNTFLTLPDHVQERIWQAAQQRIGVVRAERVEECVDAA